MKDNKINGNDKNKTMTKFEKKNTFIDDDGAKIQGSLAYSVLALFESTVNSHESQMSKS